MNDLVHHIRRLRSSAKPAKRRSRSVSISTATGKASPRPVCPFSTICSTRSRSTAGSI